MLKSKRQVWRQGAPFRFHDPLSYCCPAMIFRDILAALFGRLRAVKGQSPHDGCNAAHNQHSETRRPSHRDRIVTTGHSRFRPARPDTEFVVCNFEEDHWRMMETLAELPFIGDHLVPRPPYPDAIRSAPSIFATKSVV